MATTGQRRSGGERNQGQRRARGPQDIMSVLARAVREVEAGAQSGRVSPTLRTKFQAVALLAREERSRARTDKSISESQRAELLKRLDGIGTILARTAASDTSLMALLGEDARRLRRSHRAQAQDVDRHGR